MSRHTRAFLTVLGCAVCVAVLLVIVSACVEPVGPFDNPYDPDNPDSPFSHNVSAVSGTGSVTTMTAAADVRFEWSAVDHATMYHLHVARVGAFSDIVHDDEVPAGTTAVEVELEAGSRYYWWVRYEAEVTHKGTTSAAWGLWYGPWEVTVVAEDSGDGDDDGADESFTVSYNANGAVSGTVPADQTKIEGTDLTLAENSGGLALTGHAFAGWNTQPDGSGTSYAAGGTYAADADVTLYAKWDIVSPNMLEVPGGTFNANGTDVTISAFRMSQYEITRRSTRR